MEAERGQLPQKREPLLTPSGYDREELAEIADDPMLWGILHGKIEDRLTKDAIAWRPTCLQRRMSSTGPFVDAWTRGCESV